MKPVTAVLFDADGVLQEARPGWEEHWRSVLQSSDDFEAFKADLFAAERPHLVGGHGFEEAVRSVCERWQVTVPVEDVLKVWTFIEPCVESLALVDDLRQCGFTVALATNQQRTRLEFMTAELGYGERFDHVLASCLLGAAKPSTEYFEIAAARLATHPGELLFIDDNEPNVEAAVSAGLRAELYHLSEGIDRLEALLRLHGVDRPSK